MSSIILTKDTLIPIGAVIIVLSAAFSYGIMYQKVATLTEKVDRIEMSLVQISADVNRLIGLRTISYGTPDTH